MTLNELRTWAADDFLAATHQSMGQYRTALLRAIDDVIASDAENSSVISLSAKELLDVLELAAPDVMPEINRDHEQMHTEMCVGRLSGSIDDDGSDSGPGLFAWYTEYPEEGVIPLRLDRDVQAGTAAMSRVQSAGGQHG